MRKVILLVLFLLLSAATGKMLYLLKEGFTPRRVLSIEEPIVADWDEETTRALSQPFHYLGRGRQCFAFASEDGKYVLKLPRTDIYTTPFWVRALPCRAYRQRLEEDHLERKQFIFESFQISLQELKELTGLLFVHLGCSKPQGKRLTLIDKLGCRYSLPLEKTSFALQYKQPLLIPAFLAARQKGERSQAEHILDALLQAIVVRAKLGILNRDRSFLRNYGFDGERAYQIDVGSFFRSPDLDLESAYQKSVRDSVDAVQEWLAKTDPEMLSYLNEQLYTTALR